MHRTLVDSNRVLVFCTDDSCIKLSPKPNPRRSRRQFVLEIDDADVKRSESEVKHLQ